MARVMPPPRLRRLGRLPGAALLHGLLLLLGLVSLAWNLVALLLHPLLPARAGRALGRAVIAHCYRAFWWLASAVGLLRVDADCLDALREVRGLIVVANHPSMLDALLLVSRLPRSACIMKSSLMKNVFLGAGARLARYIRNDSPHRLVRSAVADLRQGGQLVVFPEGTRTTTGPVNAFRPGITHIAKHAGAPIQTVFIHTDSPYLAKGWPLWRPPPLPIVVRLRLGARFAPDGDSDALLRDLERYYREQLGTPGARPARPLRHRSPAMPSSTAPARPSGPAPTSRTHLVLIPSYDTGETLFSTVAAARAQWNPVWVVIDGSTDGTGERLLRQAAADPGLRVEILPRNQGKGAAVLHGLRRARAAGFTHALTMDADGQHPAALIPDFMRASQRRPDAMVLGRPVFDASAPLLRVRGRKVSNFWAQLETLFAGIGDSLYGFRVYPVADLAAVMARQPWMRRFDFDPEAAVRLAWRGVPPVNLDAPVRYLRPEEGGVSHFRYGRDNLLLTWMHARLVLGFALRLPWLLWRRLRGAPPFGG